MAPDPEEPRPGVVVVDDGSLGDVVEILRELGCEPAHLRLGAGSTSQTFTRPTRLFVTTASLACSLFLPEATSDDDGMVALAVAADESQTQTTMMRRLGFHYLVHRPTHPEALRILLRRALYRGAEHRRAQRLPLGREVRWRAGWRRARASMVEVSASGCRLHVRRAPRVGAPLRISIPAEAGGDRRIALRGRVVRREPLASEAGAHAWELAVAFEPPSGRMQRRLDVLLARCASRPNLLAVPSSQVEAGARPRPAIADATAPAAGDPAPAVDAADARPLADGVDSPGPAVLAEPAAEAPAAPAEAGAEIAIDPVCDDEAPAWERRAAPEPKPAAAAPAEPERRTLPRAELSRREIVALDESGVRALHALVGRDLSPTGMRIEPHPDLALHQRLRLALYEPSARGPLVIAAEVWRDDGDRGLALRFVDLPPEAAAELERIVASLPALQSLSPTPVRVVVGELLRDRPAA